MRVKGWDLNGTRIMSHDCQALIHGAQRVHDPSDGIWPLESDKQDPQNGSRRIGSEWLRNGLTFQGYLGREQ